MPLHAIAFFRRGRFGLGSSGPLTRTREPSKRLPTRRVDRVDDDALDNRRDPVVYARRHSKGGATPKPRVLVGHAIPRV